MSALVLELPDPETPLPDLAARAKARGLHLIHNGREIVVSPVVPSGWHKLGVFVKPPKTPIPRSAP